MTTLIAIAAWLLGLSVFVQIIQEVWKYLTNSKARSFEKALIDLVGPTVAQALQQDSTITVRGPFQFRRVGRAGFVLPTDKGELLFAMENVAPIWHRTILRALEEQAAMTGDKPMKPLPHFVEAVSSLRQAAKQGQAPGNPGEVLSFLESLGAGERAERSPDVFEGLAAIPAPQALEAFRRRFFEHLQPFRAHYAQFLRNFEFAYQRRNLRQSFVIAFVVAVVFNFPFEVIYQRSIAASPADAARLAAEAQALYGQLQTATAGNAEAQQDAEANARELLTIARQALTMGCTDRDRVATGAQGAANAGAQAVPDCSSIDYVTSGAALRTLLPTRPGERWWWPERLVRFLFGCVVTAMLLCFGAPFWNDLLSTLGKGARPPKVDDQKATA